MRKTIKRWLGKAYLRLIGWEWEGERPIDLKMVCIAAPHTSNWDTPHMLAFAFVYDVPLSFIGKHTIFIGPFNWFFRALGGIPVNRTKSTGLVAQLAEEFDRHDQLVLAVSPEGTRKRLDYWKSGFYQIALAAKVPILMGFLDFERKRGGFGPVLRPTGDVRKDMDRIRAFYEGKVGRFPDQFGPVRLRSEDEGDELLERPAA